MKDKDEIEKYLLDITTHTVKKVTDYLKSDLFFETNPHVTFVHTGEDISLGAYLKSAVIKDLAPLFLENTASPQSVYASLLFAVDHEVNPVTLIEQSIPKFKKDAVSFDGPDFSPQDKQKALNIWLDIRRRRKIMYNNSYALTRSIIAGSPEKGESSYLYHVLEKMNEIGGGSKGLTYVPFEAVCAELIAAVTKAKNDATFVCTNLSSAINNPGQSVPTENRPKQQGPK